MAQPASKQPAASAPAEPRVHPAGRLAGSDQPVASSGQSPASPGGELPYREHLTPDDAPDSPPEQAAASAGQEPQTQEQEQEQVRAQKLMRQARQHRRRQLLHDCDRLLLLDFNSLALPGWPDHYSLGAARRQRDIWLFALSLLAMLVLLGLVNLVPALVGGVSFGLLVLLGLLGVPPVRQAFSRKPSYSELLLRRHQLLKRARTHIRHLEGSLGLANSCRELGEYNAALNRSRFQGLYQLSQQGRVLSGIRSRAHCQLYLMFALEAEKAYNRLQEAYLKDHQLQLDEGEAAPLNARGAAPDPATDKEANAGQADVAPVTNRPAPGESVP